jgi:hypothetical protein
MEGLFPRLRASVQAVVSFSGGGSAVIPARFALLRAFAGLVAKTMR